MLLGALSRGLHLEGLGSLAVPPGASPASTCSHLRLFAQPDVYVHSSCEWESGHPRARPDPVAV